MASHNPIFDACMAAGIEFSGFFCDGVNLVGDQKSIKEAMSWRHAFEVLPAIQEELRKARANMANAKQDVT